MKVPYALMAKEAIYANISKDYDPDKIHWIISSVISAQYSRFLPKKFSVYIYLYDRAEDGATVYDIVDDIQFHFVNPPDRNMEIKNIKRILNSMFKKEHVTKKKVKTGRVGGPMNKYTITRSGKYYAERYIMPKAYSLINAYDFLIDRGYDPSDIREKRIIFVDMKDIAKGILKYNGIKV